MVWTRYIENIFSQEFNKISATKPYMQYTEQDEEYTEQDEEYTEQDEEYTEQDEAVQPPGRQRRLNVAYAIKSSLTVASTGSLIWSLNLFL